MSIEELEAKLAQLEERLKIIEQVVVASPDKLTYADGVAFHVHEFHFNPTSVRNKTFGPSQY